MPPQVFSQANAFIKTVGICRTDDRLIPCVPISAGVIGFCVTAHSIQPIRGFHDANIEISDLMPACLLLLAARAQAQEDVAKLASQLESPDAQVRIDACQELAKLGVKAQVAVPQLIKALKTDDAELQRQAALALGAIGEAAAPAVPALVENLTAKDPKVRAYSAHALGEIGPAGARRHGGVDCGDGRRGCDGPPCRAGCAARHQAS